MVIKNVGKSLMADGFGTLLFLDSRNDRKYDLDVSPVCNFIIPEIDLAKHLLTVYFWCIHEWYNAESVYYNSHQNVRQSDGRASWLVRWTWALRCTTGAIAVCVALKQNLKEWYTSTERVFNLFIRWRTLNNNEPTEYLKNKTFETLRNGY